MVSQVWWLFHPARPETTESSIILVKIGCTKTKLGFLAVRRVKILIDRELRQALVYGKQKTRTQSITGIAHQVSLMPKNKVPRSRR